MKKKKFVLVLGSTGSGKTTIANYLESHHRFYHFHPFNFFKRWMESYYGLQNRLLDTHRGKRTIPEGCLINMQQLMVDFFHFMENRDPKFTARNVVSELEQTQRKSVYNGIIAVSIRNLAELEEIKAFQRKLDPKTWESIVIFLSRPGSKRESSDYLLEELQQKVFEDTYFNSFYYIKNGGTEEQLYHKLEFNLGLPFLTLDSFQDE